MMVKLPVDEKAATDRLTKICSDYPDLLERAIQNPERDKKRIGYKHPLEARL
jgi:hypothetical protein